MKKISLFLAMVLLFGCFAFAGCEVKNDRDEEKTDLSRPGNRDEEKNTDLSGTGEEENTEPIEQYVCGIYHKLGDIKNLDVGIYQAKRNNTTPVLLYVSQYYDSSIKSYDIVYIDEYGKLQNYQLFRIYKTSDGNFEYIDVEVEQNTYDIKFIRMYARYSDYKFHLAASIYPSFYYIEFLDSSGQTIPIQYRYDDRIFEGSNGLYILYNEEKIYLVQ